MNLEFSMINLCRDAKQALNTKFWDSEEQYRIVKKKFMSNQSIHDIALDSVLLGVYIINNQQENSQNLTKWVYVNVIIKQGTYLHEI